MGIKEFLKMMKLERTKLLNAFKLFSFLCLIFLVMIYINIMFNDNSELSSIIRLKLKKEESMTCENLSTKNILLDIDSHSDIKIFNPNMTNLLIFSESRYVYYSFALLLGGVLNMFKIVKLGII